MNVTSKILATGAAGLLAAALMGAALVPNTSEYRGQVLFSEDGSQVSVHVGDRNYKVAWLPTVAKAQLHAAEPNYKAALAVLNRKGEIVYFRNLPEAHAVNAYGRYTEVKHTAKSLAALKAQLNCIVAASPKYY